ncbi:MAG: CopD family protein [Betaproteobacteria bacterium]|jgi:putative membrane protein
MLWIKLFHILFVVSWFAGLFYLPRIFVNLAMEENPQAQARLLLMGKKLLRFMTLLSIPALGFGVWLWLSMGFDLFAQSSWLQVKLGLVFFLIVYHYYCGYLLQRFEQGTNLKTHQWFRWFNEIPVLLLLLIIYLVVFKPL